ncbi:MAG TPA: hypothetical protein VGP21_00180, partial [Opitutaceae bacterium]|nr:hypothetical protein [Opitutaceae bacterium]
MLAEFSGFVFRFPDFRFSNIEAAARVGEILEAFPDGGQRSLPFLDLIPWTPPSRPSSNSAISATNMRRLGRRATWC